MKQVRLPGPAADYLALLNPPLIVSAAAEAFAGACLAGAYLGSVRPYVVTLASVLLFGAGSLFGHYFDRNADAQRDPDRPLPAGRVNPAAAWKLGWALLAAGMLLSLLGGRDSGAAGT